MRMDLSNRKFNFYAAIFMELWLAYHFMFIEFFWFCMGSLVIDVMTNIWLIWNRGRIAVSWPYILRIIFYIAKFTLFGCFGNQILNKNIEKKLVEQKKQERGVNYIQFLRTYEKSIVFRGASVIICAVVTIMLNGEFMPKVVSWILY